MEKFNTNVEMELDLDSVCPENFRYESRNLTTDIEYHFLYERRDWGIKSFSFILPSQELVLNLEMFNTETQNYQDVTFKLKIDGEVETPENISLGDICPQFLSLEITELQKINENSFSGKAKAVLTLEAA